MVYGVFFKPLQDEFDWSSAITSGAFSLNSIISGVVGVFMGKFLEVALISLFLLVGSFMRLNFSWKD